MARSVKAAEKKTKGRAITGLMITHPGIEHAAADEVKELLGKNAANVRTEDSAVIFDAKDHLDLCLLCYKSQSAIKVLMLLDSFSFKDEDEIFSRAERTAKTEEFKDIVGKKTSFMVKCTRIGEHGFSSIEIEQGIGKGIDGQVNLKTPEVVVYAYIYHQKCHLGIDFAGFDLSKRQYRIFNYKDALKGTFAYSLLRIAGYKKGDFLLDPFCGSGVIVIEAALYACNFPVNFYNKDKLMFQNFGFLKKRKIDFKKFFEAIDRKINLKEKTRICGYDAMLGYVKAAQKNSKIAGINKKVSISRMDVDWMDIKMREGEADKIVTNMPEITERNEKIMEKAYKEFFYQTEYSIKKKGLIVLITNAGGLVEKYSKEYGFSIKNKTKAMQGKKELQIFAIQK
ncbi:hypothetical protein COV19_04730 [Candidatus Woesearchaeota archaeon CG10_big_fil_rev_8_21_14_0_10_44_13]|nr:MAG: hypothetical protein COV19_04730 [Candidatus Woesearchaeota archaeon CG10_big_fil_rev_8_21_14_0_10_44_13]